MYKIIRKIIAAAGVIILGGLYIAAFVSAFSSQGSSGDLFKACLFGYRRKVGIFVPGLGFPGESGFKIFFGLRSRIGAFLFYRIKYVFFMTYGTFCRSGISFTTFPCGRIMLMTSRITPVRIKPAPVYSSDPLTLAAAFQRISPMSAVIRADESVITTSLR